MSDTKNSMPAQPKTTEIPAVKVPGNTLDAVLSEVRAMRIENQESTRELRADIHLVSNDVSLIKERVRMVEDRVNGYEDRAKASSLRAREPSAHDIELRSELNAERIAREALAKEVVEVKAENVAQTAMLKTLTDGASKLFANPLFRSIATAGGAALLTYLTSKGLR